MRAALYLLTTVLIAGQPDLWLARVQPLMTPAERERYQSLSSEAEREQYQAAFWTDKTITAEEYSDRVAYADAKFGSAVNSDQGRVYVALGPPTRITQLPSSRILQPLEIWRYDHVPGIVVSSEIQLLFFRPRGVGFPKLYSPQIHSVRALLINNAFGPNDIVSANDLMNRVNLSPAELEAVDAAMSVARGIKGSGNSELLYRLSSPSAMLRRKLTTEVHSHVYTPPEITVSPQMRTADNVPVIDLTITAKMRTDIGVEIKKIERQEAKLNFDSPTSATYTHRLYLLPGTWLVFVDVDGQRTPISIHVRQLAPEDPIADGNVSREAQWVSIGRQYTQAKDLARAAACFRKALTANSHNPAALAGLGRVLALDGQLDQAREYLLQALAISPNDYESLVAMAGVTARFQDTDLAREYYRRAEAIRPPLSNQRLPFPVGIK